MEPEGSLLCSQKPAIIPYPGQGQSSSQIHTIFDIILPPVLTFTILPNPYDFPTKFLYALHTYPMNDTCSAHTFLHMSLHVYLAAAYILQIIILPTYPPS